MKRSALLIAMTLLPAAVAAQQPAASPANPITSAFRGFGYYGNWLVAAFDSIPANRYDYRPTPIQMSVGLIATHLETANYVLCGRFSGMTHAQTAADSVADSLKARWPKDTLVVRLRASLTFCDSAMTRLDDSRLAEPYTMAPGRTFPRARLVIVYLTDLAEHYNQVAGYMRLLGMVPPSALPRPRS